MALVYYCSTLYGTVQQKEQINFLSHQKNLHAHYIIMLKLSRLALILLGYNVHNVISFCVSPFVGSNSRLGAPDLVLQKPSFPKLHSTNVKTNSSPDNESKGKKNESTSSVNEELLENLQEKLEYPSRIVIPANTGDAQSKHRCGFVSIIGAPNMGKSTLLNALLEHPLCVATSRPQTTRHAILGILSSAEQNCQLCFLDTPGVIKDPAYKLQEGMMESVKGALSDADILLVVTDLFSTPIEDDSIYSRLRVSDKPLVVVINKIDLMDKINPEANVDETGERTITVEDAVKKWRELLPKAMAIIPMTASEGIHNVGVEALRRLLVGGSDVPEAFRNLGRPIPGMFLENAKTIEDSEAREILPQGPPLYEIDALTDRNER